MSINSQVLATMKSQGIIDDSGLDGPANAPASEALKVHTDAKNGVPATTLTASLRQRLLNPATSYSSIVRKIEHVASMEEVSESIATKNAISFADAEEVAMTFENFKSKIRLAEFTKTPSQVNLNFTKRFMADSIKLRQEQLGNEFENFFGSGARDAKAAFDDHSELYGEVLSQELQEIQNELVTWFNNKKSLPAQVLPHNGDFINIATIPLTDFPEDFEGPGRYELFASAMKSLNGITEENIHAKALLKAIFLKEGFETYRTAKFTTGAQTTKASLLDYLQMFHSGYLCEFIQAAEASAKSALETLYSLPQDNTVDMANFNQTRDFIVKNGSEIEDLSSQVHYYAELVDLVQTIFVYVSSAFDYLKVEK